jgi:hypothetical protein
MLRLLGLTLSLIFVSTVSANLIDELRPEGPDSLPASSTDLQPICQINYCI